MDFYKRTELNPCSQIRYAEFPEMLFGELENGLSYFNATHLISKTSNPQSHSVESFISKISFWVEIVLKSATFNKEELIYISKNEDTLIEESLSLLFIVYLDESFGVYILDRMSDLLIDGVAFSDTALISFVSARFSKKELMQIMGVE